VDYHREKNVDYHGEKNVELITQSRLQDLLHYDPHTGIFISIAPRQGVKLGCRPGTMSTGNNPHRVIFIDGRVYQSSHLAVLYITGKHPKAEILHEDGANTNDKYSNLVPTDRRIDGLRERTSSRNTSGTIGVFFSKNRQKWVARITHKKIRYELGMFKCKAKAAAARKAAEARLFNKTAHATG